MNKRIMGIVLAFTMLFPLFLSSCGQGDKTETTVTAQSAKNSIYLTLYGIKGDSTTEEAVKAVEAKINKITESRYRVSLVLKLFTEAEYDDAIAAVTADVLRQKEEAVIAKAAAKAASKAATEAVKRLSDEERKERKEAVRVYENYEKKKAALAAEELQRLIEEGDMSPPDPIEGAQLDIFLVRTAREYFNNINEKMLFGMDSDIEQSNKILTKFVNPVLMGAAKVMGTTYGVPVNRPLSIPQYYVIDKALAEEYGLALNDYAGLNMVDGFLAWAKANHPQYITFANPCEIQSYDFFFDEPGFPIGARNFETAETDFLGTEFVYNSKMYLAHVKRMADYRQKGYFADRAVTAEDRFAAAVIKGTKKDIETMLGDRADEFLLVPYKKARVTSPVAFENIWCISVNSRYPSRAVEVLTGFATIPELQNLFAFGAENEHYILNGDNTVTRLNDHWSIQYFQTFNTLIGGIPEELGADYQELAKQQNINLKSSAFLGLNYKYSPFQEMLFDVVSGVTDGYHEILMRGTPQWQSIITQILGRFEMTFDFSTISDVELELPAEGGTGAPEDGGKTEDGGEPEDGEDSEDDEDDENAEEEDFFVVLDPPVAAQSLISAAEEMFVGFKKYRKIADVKIDNNILKREALLADGETGTAEDAEGEASAEPSAEPSAEEQG